ncbi:MAG: transporter [Pseudolabrys sp.]|nr:transporter [Pseudolabrys sp.]MBV9956509.1 transporter [Pseudolabrys sp.]
MTRHSVRALLLAGSAIGLSFISTVDANAGGLGVREQSAAFQGMSFAGIGTSGALSAMYWNPATQTAYRGWAVEVDAAGIFPYSSHTPGAGTSAPLLALGGAGNSGQAALVPAGYGTYQLMPNIWLGLSTNAPNGLGVSFPGTWAGRGMGINDSELKTYNISPSVAIKINEMLSIGIGFQAQYATADLNRGIGLASTSNLSGNGWGYGFTLGATLRLTPTTEVGIGYRSRIDQSIEGTFTASAATFPTNGAVYTTLRLPDIVTVGLRQQIDPRWTVLASFEWTNWSRIGTSQVYQANGAPATIALGTIPVVVALNYSDGWMVALGAEYKWSPALTLRTGVAFERSPVTDAVRTALVPDTDRIWLSAGLSYMLTPQWNVDLAYTHIFMREASINQALGGGLTYVGTANPHVDIVSAALRYQFAPEPARRILPTK